MTTKTKKAQSGAKAAANAALHRAMRQQSLRAAWRELANACEQLIRWRSFALWVRAITNAERALPEWLRDIIDQRCPGFLDGRRTSSDGDSIWLDLSGWIDERFFSAARQGGWLDALHYYSGRDPRSERVWNQWARAESAWRGRRPQTYPSFEEWHQEAPNNCAAAEEHGPAQASLGCDQFATLVNKYIEGEAFAFWVRAVVESEGELRPILKSALAQRCPGFVNKVRPEHGTPAEFSTRLWRELLAWIEDHAFAEAKAGSRLNAIRDAARTHLRAERIAAFWAESTSRWNESPPTSYPIFEEWLQHADAFVKR